MVTFPVVSGILTGMHAYGLSAAKYGDMIAPEAAAAIATSLAGFGLARRETTRLVYRLGLTLSLLSMALLIASAFVKADSAAAYPLLLASSAFLGAGLGMTIPVLTASARLLHATNEDSSVVAFHAMPGLGAIVAPGLAALFAQLGFWWGFPALCAVLLTTLLVLSARMPSRVGAPRVVAAHVRRRTLQFSLCAECILVYAVCASTVAIWSQLGLARPGVAKVTPGLPTVQMMAAYSAANPVPVFRASLTFAIFWGGLLTVGRVLFAAADRLQSWTRAACYFAPVLVLGAVILAGVLAHNRAVATIAIFGLAGLGCAALMPLKVSMDQKDVTVISAALVGGVVAYQLGYGIVADGLLPSSPGSPTTVLFFAAALVVGISMVVASAVLLRSRQRTASI